VISLRGPIGFILAAVLALADTRWHRCAHCGGWWASSARSVAGARGPLLRWSCSCSRIGDAFSVPICTTFFGTWA